MLQIVLAKESALLAAACDDLTIRLYDSDTQRLVRSFTGHSNIISDMVSLPSCSI